MIPDALSDWVGLAVFLPLAVIALFAAFERRLLRTYWRVVIRAGPLLPVVVAVIVWGWTMTASADNGLRSAMIAAIVVVTGWFVTFFFQEFRKEDARADDQEDLLLALRAEIWIYLWALRKGDTKRYGEDLDCQIEIALAKGENFIPFLTQLSAPVAFEGLRSHLHRAPADTVDTIVQFYAALSDARRFVEEMQSDSFKLLPLKRRKKAYGHYMEMRLQLEDSAQDAVKTVNRYLRVSDAEGEPMTRDNAESTPESDISARKSELRNWINSRAAAQSDRTAHADSSGHRP